MEGQPQAELRICTGVEASGTGTWVTIISHDTGSGITPEQMAHLWDMFKQSESGLGFGLWWARTFLERQGGTISCDSEPGAGATFAVHLPAHASVESPET